MKDIVAAYAEHQEWISMRELRVLVFWKNSKNFKFPFFCMNSFIFFLFFEKFLFTIFPGAESLAWGAQRPFAWKTSESFDGLCQSICEIPQPCCTNSFTHWTCIYYFFFFFSALDLFFNFFFFHTFFLSPFLIKGEVAFTQGFDRCCSWFWWKSFGIPSFNDCVCVFFSFFFFNKNKNKNKNHSLSSAMIIQNFSCFPKMIFTSL